MEIFLMGNIFYSPVIMQRHLHSGLSEEDASVYHSDPDARRLVATKRCFKQSRVAFRLCDEAPLLAPQTLH